MGRSHSIRGVTLQWPEAVWACIVGQREPRLGEWLARTSGAAVLALVWEAWVLPRDRALRERPRGMGLHLPRSAGGQWLPAVRPSQVRSSEGPGSGKVAGVQVGRTAIHRKAPRCRREARGWGRLCYQGRGKGGCREPQGSRWGPGVGKCVLMFTCPSKWGRIVAGGQRQGRPAPSTGLCLQPQLRSGGSKDPWFSAVCRTCEAVEE